MKIRRRSPITLLEIMIVIFIIGIIGSVLAYNMRGSIEEGRSYKSEHGSKQVHDFLSLSIAQGKKDALKRPSEALAGYGFVNNPEKLLTDGWGNKFKIIKLPNDEFIVFSSKWEKHLMNKKKYTHGQMEEEYPWAFYYKDEHVMPEEEVDEEESVHAD